MPLSCRLRVTGYATYRLGVYSGAGYELHRYWTTRDRAANVRLYRLAAEILAAVEAAVFTPRVGWHCQDCPVRSRCWAWG